MVPLSNVSDTTLCVAADDAGASSCINPRASRLDAARHASRLGRHRGLPIRSQDDRGWDTRFVSPRSCGHPSTSFPPSDA